MDTPIPYAYVKTDRLILRAPTLDDIHAVFTIHADPETNRHNPAGPMKDLCEEQERIAQWINDW